MNRDLLETLENEWYLVRHSGETPEIALHAALYYLSRAKDGPHLSLTTEQHQWLLTAAVERFGEIILRDLLHSNSTTPAYRGPLRSIVNYGRFLNFCRRQDLDAEPVRQQAAVALLTFVRRETTEIGEGRATLINCSYRQLLEFAIELKLDVADLPANLADICPTAE